jgi:hypothetical protein
MNPVGQTEDEQLIASPKHLLARRTEKTRITTPDTGDLHMIGLRWGKCL